MHEIWEIETEKLLKGEFECACGRKHCSYIPALITPELLKLVQSLAPVGARVLLFSSDRVADSFCKSTYLELKEGGYTVSHISLSDSIEGGVPDIPEGCAVIIAMGDEGVLERAKLLSLSFDTKLILVPTSFNLVRLSSKVSLLDYGGVRIIRPSRAPDAIALFPEVYAGLTDSEFATAFGELASKILVFCDYKYVAESESNCCDGIIYSAEKTFSSLLDKRIVKNSECIKGILSDVLRINALLAISGKEEGGEGQLTSTIERYMRKNGRKGGERGELLILSATLLIKLYDTFLKRENLYSVVDGNDETDKAKALLGLSESEAVGLGLSSDRTNYEYLEYRFKINREGIKRCVTEGKFLLDRAFSVYRRLIPDGGYHLRYLISIKEMLALVSSSAFYVKDSTLLDYIKERGLLEFKNYAV